MFGHHREMCAVAGVLGRRLFPLECAAAQICREAGARVTTNVHVRDMDSAVFNNLDGRRLEVVVDGLTLWHGAQLAIDTTLGDGSARATDHNGAALVEERANPSRTVRRGRAGALAKAKALELPQSVGLVQTSRQSTRCCGMPVFRRGIV